MPLSPDEIDAMEEVFRTLGTRVEKAEDDDEARRLFRDYMSLPTGGIEVLSEKNEPPRVYKVSKADLSNWDDPYDSMYGLDSSTTRPESYNNGLVLDVAKAKAAMLGDGVNEPERLTTIVAAVYADDNMGLSETTLRDDDIKSELIPIEYGGTPERVGSAVSTRAQKFAEGKHALRIAGLDGPLFIDGSIYPRSVISRLYFAKEKAFRTGGTSGLAQSTGKEQEQEIVENYIAAIDAQMGNEQPLIGVVKTMKTDELVTALEKKMVTEIEQPTVPWPQDDQFMSDVLDTDSPEEVTFTSWLVKTKLSGSGEDVEPIRGFEIDDDREYRDYRRAFFYVRLPQDRVVFRIEAPLMMVRDESDRMRLQRKALKEVVDSSGPPAVIERSDGRANISMDNAEYLKGILKDTIDSNQTMDYNKHGRFKQIRHDEGDT